MNLKYDEKITSVPFRRDKRDLPAPPHIRIYSLLVDSCRGVLNVRSSGVGRRRKGVSQEVKRDEEIFYARFRVLGAEDECGQRGNGIRIEVELRMLQLKKDE